MATKKRKSSIRNAFEERFRERFRGTISRNPFEERFRGTISRNDFEERFRGTLSRTRWKSRMPEMSPNSTMSTIGLHGDLSGVEEKRNDQGERIERRETIKE